jgi:hypothetical protein
MSQNSRAPLKRHLAVVSRSGRAFTPAYRPAPPTFWGQLWAALTRSTPAFTGASRPGFTQVSLASEHFLSEIDYKDILLPIFRFQGSRVNSLIHNRGHVLALTLARRRWMGVEFARQIVKDYESYFAAILGSYQGTEAEKANLDYFRAVARAFSVALTLDRLLTRDLRREQAYGRADQRRRALARARGWIRARLLLLDYSYRRRRPPRSRAEAILFRGLHAASTATVNFMLLALDGVRLRPVMVTSRRIRDKARALTGILHSIRQLEYALPFDETELARGLRQVLAGIDLTNANLDTARLAGADLRGSKLSGTSLNDANLSSAFLESAFLVNTVMHGADLTGAVLVDANLSYADLTAADLSGANMTGANLQGVVWSELTAWPAGVAIRIRKSSRRIRPGVYQVDEGGQQVPDHHVVTA